MQVKEWKNNIAKFLKKQFLVCHSTLFSNLFLCRIPWAKRAGCSSYGQIREDSKSSAAFFAGSTEVVSASFFSLTARERCVYHWQWLHTSWWWALHRVGVMYLSRECTVRAYCEVKHERKVGVGPGIMNLFWGGDISGQVQTRKKTTDTLLYCLQ
jgi:hypothetical protein